MSSPSSSVKPQKPAKVAPPNPPPGNPAPANDKKSAKELKKEKRAANVASRPATEAEPQAAAPRQARAGPPNIAVSGNPNPHANANANAAREINPPTAGPSRKTDMPEPFFSHLPTHRAPNTPLALSNTRLHPLVLRLGVLMSTGVLRGANARTMGMMEAFKQVIRDYEVPDLGILWKDLPVYLSPMIAWLEGCRPKGVGGGNAIRWLKSEITRLGEEGGPSRTEVEQKAVLIEAISVYLRDRIEFADQVIADIAKEKIKAGDTIVTYARSSVVERVLIEAWTDMRKKDPEASFNVIVVDSRPLHEGRALLKSLKSQGLSCTYVLLPLLSSILPRASLVLLGASALHSDGALYARAGTAIVAMLAKEHRVPVVACVETYKFGERVVLDGVAANELGEIEGLLDLPGSKHLKIEEQPKCLTPLHLLYDLTPPALITAVCTEIGFIPPSSVPTVLGKAGGTGMS